MSAEDFAFSIGEHSKRLSLAFAGCYSVRDKPGAEVIYEPDVVTIFSPEMTKEEMIAAAKQMRSQLTQFLSE